MLRRLLRLSCLNSEAGDQQTAPFIARLDRDLNALRHFVKHVQDVEIPDDTEPLARLCEWPWSAVESAQQSSDNVNASQDRVHENERNRSLLRHATQSASLIYYEVPAPSTETTA